jgi:hypothetical protein
MVEYAVAWQDGTPTRYVGRLRVSADGFGIDGTETASGIGRERANVPRTDICAASAERRGDVPAVRILTNHRTYLVELLQGGLGAALLLADQLAALIV